jgi:hypothetical protein
MAGPSLTAATASSHIAAAAAFQLHHQQLLYKDVLWAA